MLGLDLREMTAVTGAHLVQGGSRLLFRSITTDTRSLQAGDIFIALKGDRYDGHDFVNAALDKGAAGVIVARLPADLRRSVAGRIEDGRKEFFILQAQDTLRALGDIAHAHRMKFNIPMIGITGSTGKTTVKEMIARVLGRKYSVLKNEGTENNLIGVAWTLLRLNAAHEAGVIEMGTNHFGEIERLAEMAEPDTGIITNIGPSHLEFLISEDGVLREKASLLRRLLPCHRALINADDERLTALDGCAAKIVRFGIDNAADFRATKIVQRAGKLFFTVEGVGEFTLKALGRHNIYNALAAIATGVMHGIAPAQVREALAVCEPVPGRMSLLRAGGFEIIDDAYNANPLSVRAAVDALTAHPSAGKKFFICADMLELGSRAPFFHAQAARLIGAAGFDRMVFVGGFADLMRESAIAGGAGAGVVYSCKDTPAAVEVLRNVAREGDCLLFKGSRRMKLESIITALSGTTDLRSVPCLQSDKH